MRRISVFYLILMLGWVISFAQKEKGSDCPADFSAKIQKIISFQKKIGHVHPFLKYFYPVAIADRGYFYIYTYDKKDNKFKSTKKIKTPFPIQQGMKAAFPVEGTTMCVVTPEIFNTIEGYVFIFHEFIHCHQAAVCEQKLKENLEIYKAAMEKKNWSWELNHKFPYTDKSFVELYTIFLESLKKSDIAGINKSRTALKTFLKKNDYEYVVWQEWKEGFARYVENKMRSVLGLKENISGRDVAYNRVSFYAGGERLIKYLISENPELNTNIEKLFKVMMWDGALQSP